MSSKRGVQVELALARVRSVRPATRVWGLSATLANLDEALTCLTGVVAHGGRVVKGLDAKTIEIVTAHPATIERFPWAGHIGLKLLPQVIRAIDGAQSTLVFTNVRSATEIWYQAILEARPDWAGRIALHHGSLEREVRDWVEEVLRRNKLKAVVCTSSLDLGVDFTPVDQVLQIGSPKGVARLLQRAGRSGHQPGGFPRSRSCRRRRWNWWKPPPHARRPRSVASSRACRCTDRSMPSCSISSRAHSAAASFRRSSSPKSAARTRTRTCRTRSGSGRWTSSSTAARASTRIPSTDACS